MCGFLVGCLQVNLPGSLPHHVLRSQADLAVLDLATVNTFQQSSRPAPLLESNPGARNMIMLLSIEDV